MKSPGGVWGSRPSVTYAQSAKNKARIGEGPKPSASSGRNQRGEASGIARSACATMRVPRVTQATITIPIHYKRISATSAVILSMLYQNQKRRLRLLFDSCFPCASHIGYVRAAALKPARGHCPRTPSSLRAVLRFFSFYSNGYFTPHCARSSSMISMTRMVSLCGISGHSIAPSASAFMQERT